MTPFEYGNGYNISLFNAYNGSIELLAEGGVPPYSYDWRDGPTTQNRTALGSDNYDVGVTDANGCIHRTDPIYLRQPDRSDWTMTGNAGTNPATNYIGTSDNKDVVFKSNGAERLRLKGDGTIALPGITGTGLLRKGPDGLLGIGIPFGLPDDYWTTAGNYLHEAPNQFIGTRDNYPLVVKTNLVERMRLTTDGRLGIGTASPTDALEVHHTDERGGLRLTNDRTDANAHNEIRFQKNGNLRWALGCDFDGNGGQDFFLWDHQATTKRLVVDAAGRVIIGDPVVTNGSTLYRLYVDGGIVCRDVKVTASQSWPDYVFEDRYQLMPLENLAHYLHQNGHLPTMPSACEVEANEGVEVGDLQLRLVKTVEEQQLYILQLHTALQAMKARLNELEYQR